MSRIRSYAVFLLFLLSGASGLSLQVVWTRQLATSVGGTSVAVTTVVALFMAGLGLGSALVTLRLPRVLHPGRAYAFAELVIAATAFGTSTLLPRIEDLQSPAARALAAIALLLPPTVAMGVTWPLLTAAFRTQRAGIAGVLYAINTAGAALGCLLAGFAGIGLLGLHGTGLVAASVNASCGVVALLLFRGELAAAEGGPRGGAAGAVPQDAGGTSAVAGGPALAFLALAAVSGGVALAEEVLWTRMLLPYVNASTYAFAAILTVYLLGLALGSRIGSRDVTAAELDGVLPRLSLALAVVVAASPLLLGAVEEALPFYTGVRRATALEVWAETVLATVAKAAASLVVPTLLLGAMTPLAIRVAARGGVPIARAAGAYAAANTVGAIVGTVLGGFALLPALGAHRALIACAITHVALAVGWSLYVRATSLRAVAVAAVVVVALVGGLAWATPAAPFAGRLAEGYRVLLVDEGPQDTTTVVEAGGGPTRHRGILSNGVAYAGDSPGSRRYMSMLGHLPVLLSADPARVMVICVGTGTTAAAVARTDAVRQLLLVDISAAVHRTLPLFAHVNDRVWRDPRVTIVEADGRQYLGRERGRFGTITLEPPPPRIAGAASLYARETYARARDALREGGTIAQWIPLHGMTAGETRLLLRTFLDVFPNATLFLLTNDEAALVGVRGARFPGWGTLRARVGRPRVLSHLQALGYDGRDADEVLASVLATGGLSGRPLRALAGSGPLVTDDRPLIEQFGVGLAWREDSSPLERNGRAWLLSAASRRWTAPPVDGAPEILAATTARMRRSVERLAAGARRFFVPPPP